MNNPQSDIQVSLNGEVVEEVHSDDLINAMQRRTRIVWVSLIAFVIAITWASLAELDEVSRGHGQIIASSKTQVIQAPDGGVIEELLVREGDEVKKGQVLARLDHSRAKASYEEVVAKKTGLEATVARLRSEVLGTPLKFDGELLKRFPDIADAQTRLFQRRQGAISQEIQALSQSLRLTRDELRLNEELLKTGDVSLVDVLRLRRQAAELEGQIANKRNKYLQDAQAELAKAEEELATVSQTVFQREASLNYTVLSAPVAGIVKNVKVTTLGGVLRAGDELLTIVPADDSLLVEAKVKPADIAFIKNGLPANIKLDSYDFSIFGALNGTVVYISPDTLTEDVRGQQETFYRVHVRTTQRQFDKRRDKDIALIPGMTSTVEIKTGTNTVLNYLIKPIVKTLDESFGER